MSHGDISYLEIPVTDLARSTAFYGQLFGWRIVEVPDFPGYPMWEAPNRISGGALDRRIEGFTQPRSYVEGDSIDETLAKATARGGTVLQGKAQISETSWWAVLADPDGNHLGLFEEPPEARQSRALTGASAEEGDD